MLNMINIAFTLSATKEDGFVPDNMKTKNVKTSKIHLICKFFAYDYTCPYMTNAKNCRHIHCPIVKEAARYAKE